MQNKNQDGRSINYTPPADVKGGDLVVFADMVAVASTDIKAEELGACEAEGVFDLPKGSTLAFAQGQAVYTSADGTLSASSGENIIRAGVAWEEAAAAAPTVSVKINA